MQKVFTTILLAAIISLVTVFPFIAMEFSNGPGFKQGFPYPLFILLWLVLFLFFSILLPMIRNFPTTTTITDNVAVLFIKLVVLIVLAGFWGIVIVDQMPCFLGMPNCD